MGKWSCGNDMSVGGETDCGGDGSPRGSHVEVRLNLDLNSTKSLDCW